MCLVAGLEEIKEKLSLEKETGQIMMELPDHSEKLDFILLTIESLQ